MYKYYFAIIYWGGGDFWCLKIDKTNAFRQLKTPDIRK